MSSIKNVVLGISGGLDSSVAAILLKKKGFNVVGVFMKNWDIRDEKGVCTSEKDFEDAKYVCKHLDVQLHEVNFVKEYWNDVFISFTKDYERGFTPNPDILCNKFIKFKAFYNHAVNNLKADAIATGHYAKSSFGNFLENYQPNTKAKLLLCADESKDQTFFLSQIPQEALKRTMFPLADLTREEVKKIAIENGLGKIAAKPNSTGICFIGDRKFSSFISEYLNPKPGNFIDIFSGKALGTHDGVHLWTLGQRSNVKVIGEAYYLVKKNLETSDIYVVQGWGHPILFHTMIFTDKPYWIADVPDLCCPQELKFRFQHRKVFSKCIVVETNSGLMVVSSRPLRAVTNGQFAVFYKDNECLGSAQIIGVGPSEFSLGKTLPDDIRYYENSENEENKKVTSGFP